MIERLLKEADEDAEGDESEDVEVKVGEVRKMPQQKLAAGPIPPNLKTRTLHDHRAIIHFRY